MSDTPLAAGAEPRAVAVGPDGAIWFTEENAAAVGRMTAAGTVTGTWAMPNDPSHAAFLSGITAGPDNRMWFAEGGRAKVGAITTDGTNTITEYTTPSGTLSIASASNHLWATEFYASEVVRIDPSTGAYLQYPLSGHGQGVAADAQGNVWVTEPTTGKIARIDGTTNSIHEYTEPPPANHPEAITLGPDNNMWFTDSVSGQIGQVSTVAATLGQIKMFSAPAGLPPASIEPYGIAAGPDGALWISAYGINRIARVTVSGDQLNTFIAPHGGPDGITAGPVGTGKLYFTEPAFSAAHDQVGYVGQIDVPPAWTNTCAGAGGAGSGQLTGSTVGTAPGALDATWNDSGYNFAPFGNGAARALSITRQAADGKLVVAGCSDSGDTFGLARFNANGTLDTSFDVDGKVTTYIGTGKSQGAAVDQQNGKLVVAGTVSDGTAFAAARYNLDGSPDTSFGGTGHALATFDDYPSVHATALQVDSSKLLVVGYGRREDGQQDMLLARFNGNGTLDQSFGQGGTVTTRWASDATANAVTDAGGYVVAGNVGGKVALARYSTTDGSLTYPGGRLTSQVGSGIDDARAVALTGNRVVVVGSADGGASVAVARFDYDTGLPIDSITTPASSFALNAVRAEAIAIGSDQRIVVAGSGDSGNPAASSGIVAAYEPGSLSLDYAHRLELFPIVQLHAAVAQPDNQVVVAGEAQSAGGTDSGMLVARVNGGGASIAPVVTITAPAADATFHVGDAVQAHFQCADGTTGAALACVSTVGLDGGAQHQLSGGLLDTSAPGSYTLHVSATDGNGLTNSATLPYHVVVIPPITGCPELHETQAGLDYELNGKALSDDRKLLAAHGCGTAVTSTKLGEETGTTISYVRRVVVSSRTDANQVVHKFLDLQYRFPAPTGSGTPNPDPGGTGPCETDISFGPVHAIASCLKRDGLTWVASVDVNLNGIKLIPQSGDAKLTLDALNLRIKASGSWLVQLGAFSAAGFSFGPYTIWSGGFDWNFGTEGLPNLTPPSELPTHMNLPGYEDKLPPITIPTISSFDVVGFGIEGKATLTLTNDSANLALNVKLPPQLGGVTGSTSLHLTEKDGLSIGDLRVGIPEIWLGALELKATDVSYSLTSDSWHGETTLVLPTPSQNEIHASIDFARGKLTDVAADVAGLNTAIGGGAYLQSLRADLSLGSPAYILGGIGLSAGPSLPGGQVARGNFTLKFTFGDPWDLHATGDFKLVNIPLAKAFIDYRPGKLSFAGSIGYNWGDSFGVTAGLTGTIAAGGFEAEAKAQIHVWQYDVTGDLLVSDRALAACGDVGFNIAAGFVYRWGGTIQGFTGCDLSRYHSAAARAPDRSAHAAAQDIVVAAGEKALSLAVIGSGGPPLVTLSGPGGAVVTTPADPTRAVKTSAYLIGKDPQSDTTYVLLLHPAAGPWYVSTETGSSPIKDLQVADALPAPRVSATVSGHGFRRTLHYTIKPIAGQEIRFSEHGPATDQILGTANGIAGTLSFTPAAGPGGSRTVSALVIQDGLPRRTLTVARFVAPPPARLRRPGRLRATHRRTTLLLSWARVAGAMHYLVRVDTPSGLHTQIETRGAGTHVSIPGVLPQERDRVSVRALGQGNQLGAVAAATVGAVTVPACPGSGARHAKCVAAHAYERAVAGCAKRQGKSGAACRREARVAYRRAVALATSGR